MERGRLLVDTSVLIDHLRKTQKDRTLFYRVSSSHDYIISAMTEFEFAVGASQRNRPFIEQLLVQVAVLPFDSSCARSTVLVYHQLKASNKLKSLPDLIIAATALVHGLALLTLNQKHFSRIPELQLFSGASE